MEVLIRLLIFLLMLMKLVEIVRRKISPQEWQRNAYIEEADYDQVDEYAVPEDLRSTEVL